MYLLFPQASVFSIAKFVLRALVDHDVAVVGCGVAVEVGFLFEGGTVFGFEKFHVRFLFFQLGSFRRFMMKLASGGLLQRFFCKALCFFFRFVPITRFGR